MTSFSSIMDYLHEVNLVSMLVRFAIALLGGGIIGMSLINSIFVDAMVSDNNDDVKSQLSEMEAKIDELTKLLTEKKLV